MVLTSKHKPDDEVYFMWDNKITKDKVWAVLAECRTDTQTQCPLLQMGPVTSIQYQFFRALSMYEMAGSYAPIPPYIVPENKVFSSREELIASL